MSGGLQLDPNAEADGDPLWKLVFAVGMTALLKQKDQRVTSSLQFQAARAISHRKADSWSNFCFFSILNVNMLIIFMQL